MWRYRYYILIEVLSCLSEDERLRNRQRQREGIDAAMARGVEFGRPKLRKPDNNYEAVMQRVDYKCARCFNVFSDRNCFGYVDCGYCGEQMVIFDVANIENNNNYVCKRFVFEL